MSRAFCFSWTTQRAADRFDRRVYSVPDNVGLGWTPYRIRVLHGAISHTAFHAARDFAAWARRNGLSIRIRSGAKGQRFGRLEANRV